MHTRSTGRNGHPMISQPRRACLLSGIVISILSLNLTAAESRLNPVDVQLDRTDIMSVELRPSDMQRPSRVRHASADRACPPEVKAHTDSDFGTGQYTLQAGFEQGESAGISFVMPAQAFPLKFESAQILSATFNATVQTTTEWSILIYSGTPQTGSLVAQYSSDGKILPHLVMPPGTTGTIVQFSIAADDPEQIFIPDDGSQTFTVAFRIDAHNSPGNPCILPPSENQNAFPATDISGLQSPSGNWLDLVPGSFCLCGTGWTTFQQLPSFCTPSGDWVMNATVTPFECGAAEGACCKLDGTCLETTEILCDSLSGVFQGDSTTCADVDCPDPQGACCVPSTGACVDGVTEAQCTAFNGTFLLGNSCADVICFPEGACCTIEGECVPDVSPEACTAFGGSFQGDGTDCDTVECPAPECWCCPDTTGCFEFDEETCLAFGGTWGGAGTTCSDVDACDETDPCPADLDGDGVVEVDDVLEVLSNYGSSSGEGDVDGDGVSDVNDVLAVINGWGPC